MRLPPGEREAASRGDNAQRSSLRIVAATTFISMARRSRLSIAVPQVEDGLVAILIEMCFNY
jgi:hypothetical protein